MATKRPPGTGRCAGLSQAHSPGPSVGTTALCPISRHRGRRSRLLDFTLQAGITGQNKRRAMRTETPPPTSSSRPTSPERHHHCFFAATDYDDDRCRSPGPGTARGRAPYCDTFLLTSVRSIWMPRSGCWCLCVMIGLWATTCPAPSVVQALLSAGSAVGGLTVGRRSEDEIYGLPTDVCNDRAAQRPPTGESCLLSRARKSILSAVRRRRLRLLDQLHGRVRGGRDDARRPVPLRLRPRLTRDVKRAHCFWTHEA